MNSFLLYLTDQTQTISPLAFIVVVHFRSIQVHLFVDLVMLKFEMLI